MTPLWPPQEKAIRLVADAVSRGGRRLCLTLPTGGGKTRVMAELIKADLAAGRTVAVYTDRRLLLEQTAEVFGVHGLDPAIRAAGHPRDHDNPFQLISLQTEHVRTVVTRQWSLFPADRVYWDEGHKFTGPVARDLADRHLDHPGSVMCYVTATPIDMGGIVDELLVAGTPSELRKCGALVAARHYGPSEPDLRKLRKRPEEELTEAQIVRAIMRKGIWGLVYDNWKRLNPGARPAVLFAPGVNESFWFAAEFHKRGVKAAHIDGDDIWVGGEWHKSDRNARRQVMDDSKAGRIAVVTNRFVLREGIDMPWVVHGILATIFDSLAAYLQGGGRFLRAYPGKDEAVIQDHGGNWHRHGSLNANRPWDLTLTSHQERGMRAERMRCGEDPEPLVCPECAGVVARLTPGMDCPHCGWPFPRSYRRARPVHMENGGLEEVHGEVYVPRKREWREDAQQKWVKCYFRARNSKKGMTFRQAEALFFQENGYWPLDTFPLMPTSARDWYLRVSDVPRERLR